MLKSTFWNRYCYPHFTYRKTEAPRDLGTCSGSCPGPILNLSDSEVHAEYIISRSGIRHNLALGTRITQSLYIPYWGAQAPMNLVDGQLGVRDLWFSWERAVDMQGSQAPRVSWCGHRNSSLGPARRGTAKPRDSCQVTTGSGVPLPACSIPHLNMPPSVPPAFLSPPEVEAALVMARTAGSWVFSLVTMVSTGRDPSCLRNALLNVCVRKACWWCNR